MSKILYPATVVDNEDPMLSAPMFCVGWMLFVGSTLVVIKNATTGLRLIPLSKR